jgi:hypothetical protein
VSVQSGSRSTRRVPVVRGSWCTVHRHIHRSFGGTTCRNAVTQLAWCEPAGEERAALRASPPPVLDPADHGVVGGAAGRLTLTQWSGSGPRDFVHGWVWATALVPPGSDAVGEVVSVGRWRVLVQTHGDCATSARMISWFNGTSHDHARRVEGCARRAECPPEGGAGREAPETRQAPELAEGLRSVRAAPCAARGRPGHRQTQGLGETRS